MSPGSISQLIESDEPALRVRFDGPLPPPAERYWRGPVLHDFDGYTWRRTHAASSRQPTLASAEPAVSGHRLRYEVTLEPNQHNVLIALELPRGHPPANVPLAFETFDYQLIDPTPNRSRDQYRLESYPRHRNTGAAAAARTAARSAHAAHRNPRSAGARAYAARGGQRAIAPTSKAVLDYLRKRRLRVHASPAAAGLDSVDDLLFRTREGFCGTTPRRSRC